MNSTPPALAAMSWRLKLSSQRSFAKCITLSPHIRDALPGANRAELAAQAMQCDVECIGRDGVGESPGGGLESAPANDLSGGTRQYEHELHLGMWQRDALDATAPHAVVGAKLKLAEFGRQRLLPGGATEQGAYARHELIHREWFGEVIV